MASEQFSLCWDNFHKNMSSGMNSLLENEDLVDVTLAVEGKYLKAHKMVLSVCSPYFRELFKVNPCKHPIVFMKDVSYVAMSDLLQFMYQGEVQVSQENLTTFIKTAEALQVKGLTGDGNGATEGDREQEESKPVEMPEVPKVATTSRSKKIQQSQTPPAKRPRISAPEPNVLQSSAAVPNKTEQSPASITNAQTQNEHLIQFKMEPYDQNQSSVALPDDSQDETFTDDQLDDTNEEGNEDYSVIEGGDDEPQAGTSADGGTGEGQGANVPVSNTKRWPRSAITIDGFTYHQNNLKKASNMRLNKTAKSAAERVREYRARQKLLKQHSDQQESIYILVEDNQNAGPSDATTNIKKTSTERTKRWRAKRKAMIESAQLLDGTVKPVKVKKTSTERTRRWREKRKAMMESGQLSDVRIEKTSTERTRRWRAKRKAMMEGVHLPDVTIKPVKVQKTSTERTRRWRAKRKAMMESAGLLNVNDEGGLINNVVVIN